jgi:RNA polymerase sigma-70 factor, ECF subfamily
MLQSAASTWTDRGTAGHDTTANGADAEKEKMRRFRDSALPHLDDLYTVARYLMRNATDAEDVVQECYLRALRHFDSYRGQR